MNSPITLIDDDTGLVQLYPDWIENSVLLFEDLKTQIDWLTRAINLYGKSHVIPRLEYWNAEDGVDYQYSNQQYRGKGWQAPLVPIVDRLIKEFQWQANGALLNYYRSGSDKMGWHSDNEPELGPDPNIAILSLGSSRDFALRRIGQTKTALTVSLPEGSLLWMTGKVQHTWQHSLPKRSLSGERISCTFRKIVR